MLYTIRYSEFQTFLSEFFEPCRRADFVSIYNSTIVEYMWFDEGSKTQEVEPGIYYALSGDEEWRFFSSLQ